MAKRFRLPPLTTDDLERMLRHDGWFEVTGGGHRNFRHPEKPGKAQLSRSRQTGLKLGGQVMKGLKAQTGWSNDDIRQLYLQSR